MGGAPRVGQGRLDLGCYMSGGTCVLYAAGQQDRLSSSLPESVRARAVRPTCLPPAASCRAGRAYAAFDSAPCPLPPSALQCMPSVKCVALCRGVQVGGNASWKWDEKYWEVAYESVQLTTQVCSSKWRGPVFFRGGARRVGEGTCACWHGSSGQHGSGLPARILAAWTLLH